MPVPGLLTTFGPRIGLLESLEARRFGNPLLDLGMGLLASSGPSRLPVTLGSAFGGALSFAQESAARRAGADQRRLESQLRLDARLRDLRERQEAREREQRAQQAAEAAIASLPVSPEQRALLSSMAAIDPQAVLREVGGLLAPEGPNIGAVSPSTFTPESLATFAQTGDFADLERLPDQPLVQNIVGGGAPTALDRLADTPEGKKILAMQAAQQLEDEGLIPQGSAASIADTLSTREEQEGQKFAGRIGTLDEELSAAREGLQAAAGALVSSPLSPSARSRYDTARQRFAIAAASRSNFQGEPQDALVNRFLEQLPGATGFTAGRLFGSDQLEGVIQGIASESQSQATTTPLDPGTELEGQPLSPAEQAELEALRRQQ